MFRLIVVFVLLLTGCAQMEYQSSEEIMDTVVTITVTASNQDAAHSAIQSAFREINRVEKKFTIYDESPIQELNSKGHLFTEDEELKRMVRKSIYYSQITNSSFDITVQPVLDLYTKSFEERGRPPTDTEIKEALAKVGPERVIVNKTGIFLTNTTITLGGIAKGYAIDQAIETLQMHNISAGLVNAGGDLYGYGRKASGELWTSALRNPDDPYDYLTRFEIRDQGIATSGNYERYFDENREYHHIIDPTTGRSANDCISVTVIAPSAVQADALSTALFVMGEDGKELVKRLNLSAVFVFSNRSVHTIN
ncbi:MAG: FAD:protein FMN transferase [Nanobdellota archaeon]